MMAVYYIRKIGNSGAHIGNVKRRESFLQFVISIILVDSQTTVCESTFS